MFIAVLASGRGSNLQAIIDAIEEGRIDCTIQIVISDRPGARALERARAHGIDNLYINPEDFSSKAAYERKIVEKLNQYEVNIVVLAGYMRLVSRELLQAFPQRIINIHPSLLPAFSGLDAQRQAWEYGVKYSGCTVHIVDEGVDTGPIIAQAVVPVHQEDTPESLADRILGQEHELYPQVLQWLAENRVFLEGRRVKVES